MAVRICFRVPRQLQFRHDSSNHVLVSKNAAVGKERESLGLGVERHPPTWGFLILHVGGHASNPLVLSPHFGMTPRMGQVISVWLCFAEQRAVDKRLAINEPKDTHSRLSRPCGCLALSAFMRFLHWLILAADRSDGHAILPALLNPRWNSVAASHGTSRQTVVKCRKPLLRGEATVRLL